MDDKVLAFVMARWQESGGFGLAPTLPVSVEDTYNAFRVLETILPISKKEFRELKEDQRLKAFLMRKEDKEFWSLRTTSQYVFLCGLCGVRPEQGWLSRLLEERGKGILSLRERYYWVRILREWPESPSMEADMALGGTLAGKWRTVQDLWMCLYLLHGSPEALRTTGEAITGWVQECQNPDGGFGFLPGSTAFVENSHWALRVLSTLGSTPLSREMARDFILRCKTSGGGFARKNGAAPFLYATRHAVAALALLSHMEQTAQQMPPSAFPA